VEIQASLTDFSNLSKLEKYEYSLESIKALCESESDRTANLANATSVLKTAFGWWWVGFYLVKGEELVLGPFQGPVACTRIQYGKGVCGKAWELKKSIVLDDVEQFPGHIACSAESKSEIVVPVLSSTGEVLAIIDADSQYVSHFDAEDQKYLEAISGYLSQIWG
jgi:L-methionine (R)-S-oxide reductase